MAVYWKIKFDDGTFGWQVMNDQLGDAKVVNEDGEEVKGAFGYSWFSDTEIPPFAVDGGPKNAPE